MRPIKIWTSEHVFIVYDTHVEHVSQWLKTPIIKSKYLSIYWDIFMRFWQRWLIPTRLLKYEYIHLLEIVGEKHRQQHLNTQLSILLTEKHSRFYRYHLCQFIHSLGMGHPLPSAFASSFSHLSEYMRLLKNPRIQSKLSELIPFIIRGLDSHLASSMRIWSMLTAGYIGFYLFSTTAFILSNSTFKRLEYHHEFHYLKMHRIARAFLDTFQNAKLSHLNELTMLIFFLILLFTLAKYWSPTQKVLDPLILKMPFYGRLSYFRTTQRMLFALKLAEECKLDYPQAKQLIEEQIQNSALIKRWNKIHDHTNHQFQMHLVMSEFMAPCGIKISSLAPDHINMSLNLAHQEIWRRTRNLELLIFFTVSTILLSLILWLALTYAALERILLIFQ